MPPAVAPSADVSTASLEAHVDLLPHGARSVLRMSPQSAPPAAHHSACTADPQVLPAVIRLQDIVNS